MQIVNGRMQDKGIIGDYTFISRNGNSVVDYLIVKVDSKL